MRRGGNLGAAQGPGRGLSAVPVLSRARVGLDVPIETKLHGPSVRAEWVERPALVGRLARTATRLMLVDAPAGFGKTTLIAQWWHSAAESRPFAWVSLDRGDDDPGTLWWYIVSALQRACPEIGVEGILGELRVQAPDIMGKVLPALANALDALSAPAVLVLDDYHLIKERARHDQIAFLLLHLPPAVQVVLITRADPPLPLARMRAAGEMVEVRARELRFTPEEAAELVQVVSEVRLSEPDLTDLMERTEGWPAGVYLAALSLRGHPSPHAFIRQFTGDNRFIVDFLAEEVLSRQTDEIQQFLVRTSILPRFCVALCDAVTGKANAAGIIDVLERENLFLVPLDDNRQWYRYHHLFAQLLHSGLATTEPGVVATLHERASAWHEQWGSAEEAISHALAAADITRAIDLISRNWSAFVDIGRTATVRQWMRSLGEDRIAAVPIAAHSAAWAAALSGDQESVSRLLPVIEAGDYEGPLPDGMQSLRSSAALLRAVFGFDGLAAMHESAAVAAELEDDPKSPWYALARSALGFSRYLSGEIGAAAAPLEDAVQSEASVLLIRMMALSVLSLVEVELGRLSKARDLAEAACELASHGDIGAAPQSSLAYTAMGAVWAARGGLEEARGELDRALDSRRAVIGISPWPTFEALLLQAGVLLGLGDRASAAELAAEARDVLVALPDGTEALQARLAGLDRRITGRSREVSLADPLTDREMAVLRLLSGTMSLREIGRELYVSANTVKTHTRAIYRKLGVSTRGEAVEQGKKLGIRLRPIIACASPG
jgi:LuxR family transcriptional regulator, maltose regulon positive regulatory protein